MNIDELIADPDPDVAALAAEAGEAAGSPEGPADLDVFLVLADRLEELGRAEDAADVRAWHSRAVDSHSCIYCDNWCRSGDRVPEVDDPEAWAELAAEHYPGCEWVQTRAHRRWGDQDVEEALP